MFLTKECDYGVRIIRALANNELQIVKAICDKESVPHPYAYKILKKLERAGLVQSQQGPSGGYRLIRPLSSFTVYDVITAIDENLLVFECVRAESACPRNDPAAPCAVHQEFCRLQRILADEMQRRTMQEVLSV